MKIGLVSICDLYAKRVSRNMTYLEDSMIVVEEDIILSCKVCIFKEI